LDAYVAKELKSAGVSRPLFDEAARRGLFSGHHLFSGHQRDSAQGKSPRHCMPKADATGLAPKKSAYSREPSSAFTAAGGFSGFGALHF
jgi:hypothetical protein